jgi:hypothetical protein
VLREYKKLGMNIITHKQEVMRALSGKFPKNQMKKVYSLISAYG